MPNTLNSADQELQASATNTAGGTTTGSWIAINTTFGGLVSAKVTNGATGPTVGCEFHLDTSPDNGTTEYPDLAAGKAGVANNGVYPFHAYIRPGTRYIRSRFTGNTGQDVTVQADFQEATSVATS